MRTFPVIALGVAGAAIAGGWWALSGGGKTAPAAFDVATGARLYAENCASCHGAELEGQPDWRTVGADGVPPAPPHNETGHTWHHGDGVLFAYTKLGGKVALARQGVDFNSGMPAFGDSLSDQQIGDILAYIKSTWPDRQRDVQAARSDAERLEGDASK